MSAAAPPPYQAIPADEAGVPDDFKIGVTVDQSDPSIRALFVRKVYTLLFVQLLGTTIVAGAMSSLGAAAWIYQHAWTMWLPLVGSLVSIGLVYWKAHEHPLNLVFLGVFTLFEAVSLGMVVCLLDQVAVLKALIITTFVFLGLTLYTLQSRRSFEWLGSWLYGSLLVLVGAGLVHLFIPSRTLDLAYSVGGCVVFSGYIVYDTWLILRRLSPDDWVLANVSLYLDVVNMFISILRFMNSDDD